MDLEEIGRRLEHIVSELKEMWSKLEKLKDKVDKKDLKVLEGLYEKVEKLRGFVIDTLKDLEEVKDEGSDELKEIASKLLEEIDKFQKAVEELTAKVAMDPPQEETQDMIFEKLLEQFKAVLVDKQKMSKSEAEKIAKEFEDTIKSLAEKVQKGEISETDALLEVSRLAEEYKPPEVREAGPYISALTDVLVSNLIFYKGVSEERAREVAEEFRKDIEKLASDIVKGRIKYREAIWKVVDMAKKWTPPKAKKLKDIVRKLEIEYEAYLTEQGVTNPKKCIEYVKEDIESLAESVAKGEITIEEALERVREIPIPPIARFRRVAPPVAPTAPPTEAVPPEERVFRSPKEIADILWKYHLDSLLLFGLNYVFENYGRKYGMTGGMKKPVASELTNRLRLLGMQMEKEEQARYKIVGDFLTRYSYEIVWKGVLEPLARYSAYFIIHWLRANHPDIYNALISMDIKGSIAKAFMGVLLDYLGIPRERWPEDVLKCYEKLIEVAGG